MNTSTTKLGEFEWMGAIQFAPVSSMLGVKALDGTPLFKQCVLSPIRMFAWRRHCLLFAPLSDFG